MEVIYADSLFLINFIVNYLILLATAKISGITISRWKMALGGALGGVYAVLAVFPKLLFLSTVWFKIAVAVLMLIISFGKCRGLLRIGLIFFCVSVSFGGAIYGLSFLGGGDITGGSRYISPDIKLLLISFLLCYALISMVFSRMGKRRGNGGMVPVKIELGNKSVTMSALRDTGNALADPLTGKPVMIAELEAVKPLFTGKTAGMLDGKVLKDPVAALEALSKTEENVKFRLVSYSAVGVEQGFLLAFKADCVTEGEKVIKNVPVAISSTRVSEGGLYSALVQGE